MNTDQVPALTGSVPVMDPRKLEKQKELLLAYVQEQALLPPDVTYRYLGHEYVARKNEPMRVVLYLGVSGRGHADYEFTLEELQLFQARRFPTPSASGSIPIPPPSGPAAPVTPVVSAPTAPAGTVSQVTWLTNRAALFSRIASLEPEARRFVSAQVINDRKQMTCRCPSSPTVNLCDHLQFVYATGWERDKLLDESGSGDLRQIRLPIGMGEVYVDLEARVMEDDTLPLGKLRTGYVRIHDPNPFGTADEGLLTKLSVTISPFPREVDHVILAPGEGTIKAIRYIESLLRTTEPYKTLCALSSFESGSYSQANMVCSRLHRGESGRRLMSQFIAGLRPSNRYREGWLVACAYTIFMFGLCLPCHKATSASSNVPVF